MANSILSDDLILTKIYLLRNQKVMIDEDLAILYQVETKQLKRQVRRNIGRFPADFMFVLTKDEFENLRSQSDTSKWGGTRYLPMAFTEQGVAMLSSILNSELAIKVNIQIIRLFNRMRVMLLTHKDILLKLEEIEKKTTANETDIQVIFDYLKQLLDPPKTQRRRIGFKPGDEFIE